MVLNTILVSISLHSTIENGNQHVKIIRIIATPNLKACMFSQHKNHMNMINLQNYESINIHIIYLIVMNVTFKEQEFII